MKILTIARSKLRRVPLSKLLSNPLYKINSMYYMRLNWHLIYEPFMKPKLINLGDLFYSPYHWDPLGVHEVDSVLSYWSVIDPDSWTRRKKFSSYNSIPAGLSCGLCVGE